MLSSVQCRIDLEDLDSFQFPELEILSSLYELSISVVFIYSLFLLGPLCRDSKVVLRELLFISLVAEMFLVIFILLQF